MGSISAMIASLKNNKRTRVSTFEKIKNFKEGKNIQVHFSERSTPNQLKKIKKKLQNENRKSLRRNLFLIILMMLILIYCVGFIKL